MCEDDFLQSMLMKPSNDLLLVFCDWLEERGDPRNQILRAEISEDSESVPIDYDSNWISYKGQLYCRSHKTETIRLFYEKCEIRKGQVLMMEHRTFDWDNHRQNFGWNSKIFEMHELPLILQVALKYKMRRLRWPKCSG